MAFKVVKRLTADTEPFEYYLGTDAEAYTLGEALVQTSGRLTKCGATAAPEFICMKTQAAEATAATPIPVIRVRETTEFATTSTATVADTVVGSKVTLHTDGLTVTATTNSGVFEISQTDGATTNSAVRGYFRR
jgi:hypothetical protein